MPYGLSRLFPGVDVTLNQAGDRDPRSCGVEIGLDQSQAVGPEVGLGPVPGGHPVLLAGARPLNRVTMSFAAVTFILAGGDGTASAQLPSDSVNASVDGGPVRPVSTSGVHAHPRGVDIGSLPRARSSRLMRLRHWSRPRAIRISVSQFETSCLSATAPLYRGDRGFTRASKGLKGSVLR